MNIVKEHTDELNAILKIQLTPEDYKPKVDEAIRKYKKTVKMPGFRPGHVPDNLVRKMYGKAIFVDELNRLVADSVDTYIAENNLQVLGNPLPKPENDLDINWDLPAELEFSFDLALAPAVDLPLPPAHTFTEYDITVDEERIDEEVDKLARRYGNYTSPDKTDGDCSLYGTFLELTGGEPTEGGLKNQAFMMISKITDEAVRSRFNGLSVGDTVVFNPVAAIPSEEEVKYLLGIREGSVQDYNKDWRFSLERINKVEKAEVGQVLFDQVYGEGEVESVEAFREKIRSEIAQGFKYEAEHALKHEMEDVLLGEANLSLPDQFLKRWLKHTNEKITDEQLDLEYGRYARDLKWRLIENRIFSGQQMQINRDEIENFAKTMIIDQYMRYGQAHLLDDDKINELAARYLKNQESLQRVVENLTARKVFEYLNGIVNKSVKQVTHKEFSDLMEEHHRIHHHH